MSRVTVICAVCERPQWLNRAMPVWAVKRGHPAVVAGLPDRGYVCALCCEAILQRDSESRPGDGPPEASPSA